MPPIREVSILLGAVDAGRAFAAKVRSAGQGRAGKCVRTCGFTPTSTTNPPQFMAENTKHKTPPQHQALKDGYSVSLYPGGSKEIYTTNPYTAETK